MTTYVANVRGLETRVHGHIAHRWSRKNAGYQANGVAAMGKTADPSTAPLAMKVRETSLRMISIFYAPKYHTLLAGGGEIGAARRKVSTVTARRRGSASQRE
jgi:hypothetical protein